MNKIILTNEAISKLNRMFENEAKYRSIMTNLWKTRKGLLTIIDKRPELKASIADQFHTLNHLVDAFYNNDLPHPIYEEGEENITTSSNLLDNKHEFYNRK